MCIRSEFEILICIERFLFKILILLLFSITVLLSFSLPFILLAFGLDRLLCGDENRNGELAVLLWK